MATIHLKELAHSYHPNPKTPEDYALKRLDHIWEDGKAYALLGPSGCGKTTLLNIISGLITPTQGQVLFDDLDITHLPTERRHIAQVFQFPVIYDTMTVYDNLAFPLKNLRHDKETIHRRVIHLAEILELETLLHKKAKTLTADTKQKISLGRGLVRQSVSAILFDEPLTVIDPKMKWELRRQLKFLHQQLGQTMIYVTHDQSEALTFADQIVVMHDGDVVQIGSSEELFKRPQHTFVGYFIGSPGMNILPVKLDQNQVIINDFILPLKGKYASRYQDNIELGIRPEFVTLSNDKQDGLPIRIKRIENIGNQTIVRTDYNGQEINVVIPDGHEINGNARFIKFNPDDINLYHKGWILEKEVG